MKTTAIGYVRVSTEDQAENGVSLAAQRERIAAWCDANGYELAAVHVDAGISGKRADNRPGLQAAVDAACAGKAALVVYGLSRLARSVRDTLDLADRLDRSGADLVSLSERIDSTTAAGKMVFRMLAVLAEFERDLTAERTRAALAHKRANGEAYGETPFGYVRAGDRLEADPDAQLAVALVLDLRGRGWTFRAIARELEAREIPTAKGGSRWDPKTVQRIAQRAARKAA
jgi:DNA invertase Pin-like site-specific DNA recombinase